MKPRPGIPIQKGAGRLPRGIPAASLKHYQMLERLCGARRLPRGIPAASLKPERWWCIRTRDSRLPRGIPAASLKPQSSARESLPEYRSSAGNTRGLIEATASSASLWAKCWCLPRGIPAASLKQGVDPRRGETRPGLPRGIPAASLKPERWWCIRTRDSRLPRGIPAASLKPQSSARESLPEYRSSAGNTRGLIEATASSASLWAKCWCLPRGIPAASLKQGVDPRRGETRPGLPRGIPAASLKHD